MSMSREEIMQTMKEIFKSCKSDEGQEILMEIRAMLNKEIGQRVEVIDDKRQMFNGHIYYKNVSRGDYIRYSALHIDVMEHFNGKPNPKGYEVHHIGKDENDNFDRNKNNIEDLQLISRLEHIKIHSSDKKTYTCKECGKTFEAIPNKGTGNCFCSKKCSSSWWHKKTQEERKCVICGNKFMTRRYTKAQTCSKSCAAKLRISRQRIKQAMAQQ